MTTICKDCGVQGMGVHHCEEYHNRKRPKCPYCESTGGFYYDRTLKFRMSKSFRGIIDDNVEIEVVYENTTKRCVECDESITSYVKSLNLKENP